MWLFFVLCPWTTLQGEEYFSCFLATWHKSTGWVWIWLLRGCREAAKSLNPIQKVMYSLPGTKQSTLEWSWGGVGGRQCQYIYVSCISKHCSVFNVYILPCPLLRLVIFQCWVFLVYKWNTSFPAFQPCLQRQNSSHFKHIVAHRALLNTEWQLIWPLVIWKWLWQISFVCTFLGAESEDSSEAQANSWVMKQ